MLSDKYDASIQLLKLGAVVPVLICRSAGSHVITLVAGRALEYELASSQRCQREDTAALFPACQTLLLVYLGEPFAAVAQCRKGSVVLGPALHP